MIFWKKRDWESAKATKKELPERRDEPERTSVRVTFRSKASNTKRL